MAKQIKPNIQKAFLPNSLSSLNWRTNFNGLGTFGPAAYGGNGPNLKVSHMKILVILAYDSSTVCV